MGCPPAPRYLTIHWNRHSPSISNSPQLLLQSLPFSSTPTPLTPAQTEPRSPVAWKPPPASTCLPTNGEPPWCPSTPANPCILWGVWVRGQTSSTHGRGTGWQRVGRPGARFQSAGSCPQRREAVWAAHTPLVPRAESGQGPLNAHIPEGAPSLSRCLGEPAGPEGHAGCLQSH